MRDEARVILQVVFLVVIVVALYFVWSANRSDVSESWELLDAQEQVQRQVPVAEPPSSEVPVDQVRYSPPERKTVEGRSFFAATTSQCVKGSAISSVAYADDLCVAEFGEGWEWAEWHDSYNYEGYRILVELTTSAPSSRVWVDIDDQRATCYNNDRGMTWTFTESSEPNSGSFSCAGGLWQPGDDFHGTDRCDSYHGDTSCSECRPLLCIKGMP